MEFLILLAIIPVYIICKYVYDKDHVKESSAILEKLFICGILSCFLVLILSKIQIHFFPFFGEKISKLTNIEAFCSIFFGVGLIEEFCKWTMVYLVAYRVREFDEVYDGIVYAVFVALGFAAFENIIYVLFSKYGIILAGARALTAVPAHACFGIVMGSFISLAKISNKEKKHKMEIYYLLLSILIPSIIHTIYDFLLSIGNAPLLLCNFILIILLYIYCINKIKKESTSNKLI